MSKIFLLASSLLLAALTLAAAGSPVANAGSQTVGSRYASVELGTLGGPYSHARAINNAGQIVGESSFNGDDWLARAFLYQNGVMTDLGTLGGTSSRALGINNSGHVTGYANLPGDFISHAFLYSDGRLNDLGAPAAGVSTLGHAINDAGLIVGETDSEAMVYWRGHMLATHVKGARIAYGVNNAGQIVGMLGNDHAFLYSHGRVRDLGTMGGRNNKGQSSFAYAINDRGQIVGGAFNGDGRGFRAFIYENGVMRDLGNLNGGYSIAYGINNDGVIVGESDGVAFIYRDGVMTDLNSVTNPDPALLRLEVAYDINDGGQIVGRAAYLGRGSHAMLLNPVE